MTQQVVSVHAIVLACCQLQKHYCSCPVEQSPVRTLLLQDIGESEASELVRLNRPLLDAAVPELLGDVDLSNQAEAIEGLDIKELVCVASSCRGTQRAAADSGRRIRLQEPLHYSGRMMWLLQCALAVFHHRCLHMQNVQSCSCTRASMCSTAAARKADISDLTRQRCCCGPHINSSTRHLFSM